MSRYTLYLLLVSVILVLPQGGSAQSDDSSLPWCHQPSDVGILNQRSGYSWVSQYGNGPDGIRPVYQEYNHRIILMTSNTREVMQIIEEGIDTNGFTLLGYSSDCRYMAAGLGARGERRQTVIWDLSTNPATRLGSFDDGVGASHRLDWSPDGRYVVVSTRNAAYLWNLTANTQTELVADVVSDCDRRMTGCVGTLYAYAGLQWDTANGVVRVNLNRVGYTVTFDLNTGQPVGYTERNGTPVTEEEAETVEGRVESPYGCVPKVQYQTYNQRLVLKDWITGDLLDVVEDHLNLAWYQFLGWSATCQYIAAAIDAEAGLELVAWNIGTHTRTTTPITDYVDRLNWSPVGNVALVQTDGGAFLWNIDNNQQFPISAVGVDGRSIYQLAWRVERNMLLVVTASASNVVTAYNVFDGQVVATFDNPVDGSAGAGFTVMPGGQWLLVGSSVRGVSSGVFSFWNLENHAVIRVASTFSPRRNSYRAMRFSPGGRYIYSLIYNSSGYTYQRVEFWDVQTLSGSEPHPPTSVVDFGETWDVQFVDEHIVESYTSDANQYEISRCIKYRTAYRWDVRTGELLSETPILRDGC